MKHFSEPHNTARIAIHIIAAGITALLLLVVFESVPVNVMIELIIFIVVELAVFVISHYCLVTHLPSVEIPPKPRTLPTISKRKLGSAIELSAFSAKRINEKIIGIQDWEATFEQRKPLLELFLQIEKRERTSKNIRKRGVFRQQKGELSKKSTLYEELFYVLISLLATVLSFWLIAPLSAHLEFGALLPPLIGFIALCWALTKLYKKWGRVYYYRLIALKQCDEDGNVVNAQLVVIDQPPYFKGGGVYPIDFSRIRIVYGATVKDAEKDADTWRSNLAGMVRYEGLIVDTFSDKDKAHNWLGPFFNTPELVAEINFLKDSVRSEGL